MGSGCWIDGWAGPDSCKTHNQLTPLIFHGVTQWNRKHCPVSPASRRILLKAVGSSSPCPSCDCPNLPSAALAAGGGKRNVAINILFTKLHPIIITEHNDKDLANHRNIMEEPVGFIVIANSLTHPRGTQAEQWLEINCHSNFELYVMHVSEKGMMYFLLRSLPLCPPAQFAPPVKWGVVGSGGQFFLFKYCRITVGSMLRPILTAVHYSHSANISTVCSLCLCPLKEKSGKFYNIFII